MILTIHHTCTGCPTIGDMKVKAYNFLIIQASLDKIVPRAMHIYMVFGQNHSTFALYIVFALCINRELSVFTYQFI